MIAEPLLQAAGEVGALLADVFEEVVAAYHPLNGKRRRAGEGMAGIGVAVLEGAGALGQRLEDLALQEERADRREAAAQSFGDGDKVGTDAILLAGIERAGAAHAAHHL